MSRTWRHYDATCSCAARFNLKVLLRNRNLRHKEGGNEHAGMAGAPHTCREDGLVTDTTVIRVNFHPGIQRNLPQSNLRRLLASSETDSRLY